MLARIIPGETAGKCGLIGIDGEGVVGAALIGDVDKVSQERTLKRAATIGIAAPFKSSCNNQLHDHIKKRKAVLQSS